MTNKQYSSLESLHQKYKKQGFSVVAFPANNFGRQEPGTNLQIKEFCRKTKKATFDLYAKISVKGEDQHPLYRYITDTKLHPKTGGDPKWNFAKYLVNHEGKVVAAFGPREDPMGKKITVAVDATLRARGPVKKGPGKKGKGAGKDKDGKKGDSKKSA